MSRVPANEPAAAIVLSAYDPAWPQQFGPERLLLAAVLAPWLAGPIEHIGSTAVPQLVAKPVIDIMAAVESLPASLPALAAAARAGYLYAPYQADVMHWFCKPSPSHRTHHLHLVPFGSPLWHQRLAFRDALRADPHLAAQYAQLKLRLAQRFADDREAYTEAKGPFVQRVLSQGR
jgi:GrpB-like predicted nucleotidyltransferase (UPF0157 family)